LAGCGFVMKKAVASVVLVARRGAWSRGVCGGFIGDACFGT
jgi:hypothetical protein